MPSQRPAPTTVPPTSDTAGLAADLFRHVSADKASRYRAIMDVFAAATPAVPAATATRRGAGRSAPGPKVRRASRRSLPQLSPARDLGQPGVAAGHRARVEASSDFYRAAFSIGYRAVASGRGGAEAVFVQTMQRRAELQTVALEDITNRLQSLELLTATADGAEVDGAELDVAKVHETLRDLVRVFEEPGRQRAGIHGRGLRSIELQQANATAVVAYKRRLIDYLERFIGDLVRRAQAIGRLLTRLDDRIDRHLQAEIASEIQRLLQAAERQLDGINRELHKRPTSTGVRFRLLWQPLTIDEGAPVGLEAARKQLMNTSADLWTAEDREVIGDAATAHPGRARTQRDRHRSRRRRQPVRATGEGARLPSLASLPRSNAGRTGNGAGCRARPRAASGRWASPCRCSLRWRASTPGQLPLAPRLILLDEVLAGIDDAARAHCMGLMREFDLDFVVDQRARVGLLRGAAGRVDLPVAAPRRHRRRLRLALVLGWSCANAAARSRSALPAGGGMSGGLRKRSCRGMSAGRSMGLVAVPALVAVWANERDDTRPAARASARAGTHSHRCGGGCGASTNGVVRRQNGKLQAPSALAS